MDCDAVVQQVESPKLTWFLLTNRELNTICPVNNRERYLSVVHNEGRFYKLLLDQQEFEEEIMVCARTNYMPTAAIVHEAHMYTPLNLRIATAHAIDTFTESVFQCVIHVIRTEPPARCMHLMLSCSATHTMAAISRAAQALRKKEGITELTMAIIGERCFWRLFANDEHGGFGFVVPAKGGWESLRLALATQNFIKEWPTAFYRGALFAAVSGNLQPYQIHKLYSMAIAPPEGKSKLPRDGLVPRWDFDPITSHMRLSSRGNHNDEAAPAMQATDAFLEQCNHTTSELSHYNQKPSTPLEPVFTTAYGSISAL